MPGVLPFVGLAFIYKGWKKEERIGAEVNRGQLLREPEESSANETHTQTHRHRQTHTHTPPTGLHVTAWPSHTLKDLLTLRATPASSAGLAMTRDRRHAPSLGRAAHCPPLHRKAPGAWGASLPRSHL